MLTEEIKTIEKDGFTIKIEVVDFCEGSMWFDDLYTASEHKAGETIQVPRHLQNRDCPIYYIGETSPAELAKSYAEQGKENASAEAYKSLQDELGWYITATDCAIEYTISRAGIKLDSILGCCFDFSYEYAIEEIQEYAKRFLVEEEEEKVAEMLMSASDIINKLTEKVK